MCETRGVTETVTFGVSSDGFVGWAVCEQGRVTHTVGLGEPSSTSAPACLRGVFCVGSQDSMSGFALGACCILHASETEIIPYSVTSDASRSPWCSKVPENHRTRFI